MLYQIRKFKSVKFALFSLVHNESFLLAIYDNEQQRQSNSVNIFGWV